MNKPMRATIMKILKNEIPFLGICLGGQILAQSLGAQIKKAENYELGWIPLQKSEEASKDPLFEDMELPPIFQLHWDVFDLPEGAVHLLSSEQWKNQAFRFGRNAYGFQFHPEVNAEMLDGVYDEYKDKLEEKDAKKIIDYSDEKISKGRGFLKTILSRLFLK